MGRKPFLLDRNRAIEDQKGEIYNSINALYQITNEAEADRALVREEITQVTKTTEINIIEDIIPELNDVYVRRDGSKTLLATWDIGDGRRIDADEIRARDGDGLKLFEDGGAGIFVENGGQVGVGTTTLGELLDVQGGSIRAQHTALAQITCKTTATANEADFVATADTANATFSAFGSTIGGTIAGLTINNMVFFEGQSCSSFLMSTVNSVAAPIVFAPQRSESMRIEAGGNWLLDTNNLFQFRDSNKSISSTLANRLDIVNRDTEIRTFDDGSLTSTIDILIDGTTLMTVNPTTVTIGSGTSALRVTPSGTDQLIETLIGDLDIKLAGNDINIQDSTGTDRLKMTVGSSKQLIESLTGNLRIKMAGNTLELEDSTGASRLTFTVGSGDQSIETNTGDLNLIAASDNFMFRASSPAGDRLSITVTQAGDQTIRALTNDLVLQAAGNDFVFNDSTAAARIQFTVSATNQVFTSLGSGSLILDVGNDTTIWRTQAESTNRFHILVSSVDQTLDTLTGDLAFDMAGSEAMRINSDGKVGIGIATAPDGTLHVHTATAGAVTAHANADDFIVEGSGGVGASLLTGNTNNAVIYFGSPSDNLRAAIQLQGGGGPDFVIGTDVAGGVIRFNTAGSLEALFLDASQNVGIGKSSAVAAKLHVDQSSTSAAIPVLTLDQGDIDDTFINYIGTSAADGSRSISSDTTEDDAKFGAVRCEINGVTKWIRIYDGHS